MSDKLFDRKAHWENIYRNKAETEVSWYQQKAEPSFGFIQKYAKPDDKIIDIGGGDSNLHLELVQEGFSDLTVLDISEFALTRAKNKVGVQAGMVNWIETDIVDFSPKQHHYDLWHDRAVFHFLTHDEDRKKYVEIVSTAVKPGGIFIVAAFSLSGPSKCSGIPITQYSVDQLSALFLGKFDLIEFKEIQHQTPFATTQDFIFLVMQKKSDF